MTRPHTHPDFDAIDLLLDEGIVAYQRALARAVGDATTGLLLSQFWYWSKRLPDERDGWFYKSQDEIFEETVLTRREQETARRNLRDLGILEELKRGIPSKLWFRINRRAVKELLQAKAAGQDGGKRQPRMAESANQGCADRPLQSERNRQAKTKSTTGTTPEITAAPAGPARPGRPAAADPELVRELLAHHVNRTDAVRLAVTKPEECRRQLDYLRYLPERTNPGGWLRDAIENGHGAPPAYREAKRREELRARQAAQAATEQARQRHEAAHRAAYLSYLTRREGELQRSHPEAISAFLAQEAEERGRLERAPAPATMLARVLNEYDEPAFHLQRLQRFFSQAGACAILGFWEWDATHNPTPFQPEDDAHGPCDNCRDEPEGWRRQDDDRSQPRRRTGTEGP